MWLLSTDRAELHYFSSSDAITDGYAILSHTWEGQEQTHQEVLAIGARCSTDGTNPRDFVCSKIHQSCVLAETHGFRWVWIDSCCIDKTSSTELSEAINSMFRWYAQAEVCYAYLVDVPSSSQLAARTSPFRKSRWHTRGWTLQELIAPAIVVFVSGDWQVLGTKANLAGLLQDVTGIDQKVLTRDVRLSSCSISVRMCWASQRNTTRVEDEAYCLMGLFGVSMPTIYGEGRRAFLRLQYEIMSHSSDISLFAWFTTALPGCGKLSSQRITFLPGTTVPDVDPTKYLLAPSPQHFVYASHYTPDQGGAAQQPYPPYTDIANAKAQSKEQKLGPFDRVELPRIAVTSYGVQIRLPIFEVQGVTVAVPLCRLVHGNEHLGLILTADSSARDPTRRRYHVGARYRDDTWTNIGVLRLASLGTDLYNLRFDGEVVRAQWHTIYIVPAPPDWASPEASVSRFTLNCGPDPPFRLPHALVSKFVALDFTPTQSTVTTASSPRTVTRIVFDNPYRSELIYLDLGLCRRPGSQQSERGARWARAMIGSPAGTYGFDHPDPGMHDCARHHIDLWEGQAMSFGGADRTVRLSFAPCKIMPETTVVVHVELSGFAYEDMLRTANGSFSTPIARPTAPFSPSSTPSTTVGSLELSVRASGSLPPSPGPSTPRVETSAPGLNPFLDTTGNPSPPPPQHQGLKPLAAAGHAQTSSSRSGSPSPSASYDGGPLEPDTSWILDGILPEEYTGSEVWT
ncbi:heterokaryon incompatibility protein-domain-containing protein [Ganoderma leucocontextum]|nr:heterokaryon incompatibility protein-domain-containing protein [Ganoderma leucocontextum]